MASQNSHGKRLTWGLLALVIGVLVGLTVSLLASTAPVAVAGAAVVNVQGVQVKMCGDGGQVFGTDFGLMYTAEGEPMFETFDNLDELVMLDGTRVDDAERIEGTDAFVKPSMTEPGRVEVLYEVVEVRKGEYAVESVMACDYETLLDRTGYQP